MAQTSRTRGMIGGNPGEMGLNPRIVYPDGIIEGYTNPVFAKTSRPRGSAYQPASGYRKTVTERRLSRPGGRRMVMGRGFARDITHDPWGSTEPEWRPGGGPLGPAPEVMAHDASPEALADPRTHSGRAADNAQEVMQPGYVIGSTDLGGMIGQLFSGGPITTLLLIGAAGALVVGLLGSGGIAGSAGRGAAGVGTSTARVGSAAGSGARNTADAGLDGINKAFGSAVETLDKATPGR